jgi:hypothetical protein
MAKSNPIPDVVIHMTPRLRSNDCAIWALHTLLHIPYDQVQLMVAKVDKKAGGQGLTWTQVKNVAKKLGTSLTMHRKYELDEDTGILGVTFIEDKPPVYHAVVLSGGKVFDVDGTVWDADDYRVAKAAEFGTLLTIQEQ